MPTPIHLPDIPDTERTALVEQLVELIEALAEDNQRQAQTIQQLRDEIKVLKGENAAGKRQGKRPGSAKRHKTAQLMIHEECPIPPREPPPAGARF
jgi:hypothetical protein